MSDKESDGRENDKSRKNGPGFYWYHKDVENTGAPALPRWVRQNPLDLGSPPHAAELTGDVSLPRRPLALRSSTGLQAPRKRSSTTRESSLSIPKLRKNADTQRACLPGGAGEVEGSQPKTPPSNLHRYCTCKEMSILGG